MKSIAATVSSYIFETESSGHDGDGADSGLDMDTDIRMGLRRQLSDSELRPEEEEAFDRIAFLSPFIMTESNGFRKLWECLLFVLLLYIGTIFPYQISFVEFRLHAPGDCEPNDEAVVMEGIEYFISVFFWVDLFLNFFLTYRTEDDVEIASPSKIMVHYLSGFFGVNLLACLPEEVFSPLIGALDIDPGGCSYAGSANSAARLARLQRVTRLARLARLLRIFKIVSFMQKSVVLQLLKSLRSLRLLNSLISLCWVVHLLACGWYIVAALHENHLETWPNRRGISTVDETTLIYEKSFIQWVHAMYFILTVFTTVGFGDMYPVTVGEIAYVAFVMMIGAVVHSIIISEVINLVSEVDEGTRWKRVQTNLLEAYSCHTRLDSETKTRLTGWVSSLQKGKSSFEPADARKLFTSGIMPRQLLGELPDRLFDGQLVRNKLLTVCAMTCMGGCIPPRFPLLMSTVLSQRTCKAGEIVFQLHDQGFNLFLVMSGTFAFVCEVTGDGAVDAAKDPDDVLDKAATPGNGLSIGHIFSSKRTVGTDLDNNMVDASPKLKDSSTTKTRRHSETAMDYYHTANGETVAVWNPKEHLRSYSSSFASGNVYSALGQTKGAWTPDSSNAREWLKINLGTVKTACGVCVQGHPKRDEWVTKLKVYASRGGQDWEEVPLVQAGPEPAAHHDAKVEFKFQEPIATQFIRIEPQEWRGAGASLRAAVHVLQQRLYPYKVVGRNDYFGEDILMGCTRTATVRCEKDGVLMTLHKQDLVESFGAGGARLLDEFPQFRRVLRTECLRLRAQRKRILQYVRTGHRHESLAAYLLQDAWRNARRRRNASAEQSPAAPSGGRSREPPREARNAGQPRPGSEGPAAAAPGDRGRDTAKVDRLITDLGALREDVGKKFGAVSATLERLEMLVLSLPQHGGAASI